MEKIEKEKIIKDINKMNIEIEKKIKDKQDNKFTNNFMTVIITKGIKKMNLNNITDSELRQLDKTLKIIIGGNMEEKMENIENIDREKVEKELSRSIKEIQKKLKEVSSKKTIKEFSNTELVYINNMIKRLVV